MHKGTRENVRNRITPLHNARLALQARLPPRMDVTHERRGSYLQLALVPNLHRLRVFHLARRYPLLVDEGAVSTAQVCEEELSSDASDFCVVLAAADVIQGDVVGSGAVLGAADRASHARDYEERPYLDTRLRSGHNLSQD